MKTPMKEVFLFLLLIQTENLQYQRIIQSMYLEHIGRDQRQRIVFLSTILNDNWMSLTDNSCCSVLEKRQLLKKYDIISHSVKGAVSYDTRTTDQ